ncbi:MAG: glycosyltransferase family 4 protein [Thermoanaerobaculum sp.]|nr:glycosyltransferase family 4 protein [Thermoanaerobaculum sp.]
MPLRIAQVLEKTSLATGSVRQMLEAAREMARRGHEVMVVTRPDPLLVEELQGSKVAYTPLPLRHEADWASVRAFARLAREHRLQVVHVHKGIAHAVSLAATWLGARYALFVNRGVTFPVGFFSRWKYRSRRVTKVVAVCEAIRRVVLASTGLPEDKVVTVYAGVDTERFHPERVDGLRVRQELGIPSAAPLVGHVGIRDWKGWRELVAAFVEVRRKIPEAQLLLVGCRSPAQAGEVVDFAASLGLRGGVHATLARRDMPHVLAACDLVVDPSWAGTGITGTIREALALAKPVVATAVGGNPELVVDGVCGLLVPPRDLATLAAAMVRLLKDRELAQRLGQAGRARVEAGFSTAVRGARLEELYQQAVTALGL